MLEDELLKIGFILGSPAALARIYRKYADALKTLAMVLLNDEAPVTMLSAGRKPLESSGSLRRRSRRKGHQ